MSIRSRFQSSLIEQLRSFQVSICDVHDMELRELNAEQLRLQQCLEAMTWQKEQFAERLSSVDPEFAMALEKTSNQQVAKDASENNPHVVALGEPSSVASASSSGPIISDIIASAGNDEDLESTGQDNEQVLDRWKDMLTGLKMLEISLAGPAGDGEVSLYVHQLIQKDQHIGILEELSIFSVLMCRPMAFKLLAWELVGLVLVLYDIILFPFTYAFDVDSTAWMLAIQHAILCYWICDLVFRFFVGYFDAEGILEMRVRQTALRYVKTTFAFDLFIVLIDIVFTIQSASSHLARAARIAKFGKVARIIRALRAVRVMRIVKYNEMIDHFVSAASSELQFIFLQFIRLIAIVLAVNHFLACLWWTLGTSGLDEEHNWVGRNHMELRSLVYRYLTSLHWAVTQFTPASMEVTPTNKYERGFAICTVIFGMVAFSSVISSITGLMVRLKNYGGTEKERENQLRIFLRDHRISFALSQRLWNFLNSNKAARKVLKHEDNIELLQTLPDVLRLELKSEVYIPTLVNHSLFHQMALREPSTLQNICVTALKHVTLSIGHQYFEKGTPAKGMLFLSSGSLLYSLLRLDVDDKCVGNDSTLATNTLRWMTTRHRSAQALPGTTIVEEGGWVSEAALWVPKWVHCGWLVGLRVCELFVINSDDFHEFYSSHTLPSAAAVSRYGAYFHHLMCEVGIWRYDGITDVTPEKHQVHEMAVKSFAATIFPGVSGNRLPGIRDASLWGIAQTKPTSGDTSLGTSDGFRSGPSAHSAQEKKM